MPEDLRVTEIGDAVVGDDGVAVIFHERLPVPAPGEALCLIVAAVCGRLRMAGIDEDEDRIPAVAEAAGVRAVEHRRAGEAGAVLIRVERDGLLCPAVEIRARRMAPVHRAPAWIVGMVLVEGVIAATGVDQAIGIVGPVLPGGQTIVRAFHLVSLLVPASISSTMRPSASP